MTDVQEAQHLVRGHPIIGERFFAPVGRYEIFMRRVGTVWQVIALEDAGMEGNSIQGTREPVCPPSVASVHGYGRDFDRRGCPWVPELQVNFVSRARRRSQRLSNHDCPLHFTPLSSFEI